MELLIGAAVTAVLLLVLVLAANRRQRGADAGPPHLPPSAGTGVHGSPGTNSWPLGGSGSV